MDKKKLNLDTTENKGGNYDAQQELNPELVINKDDEGKITKNAVDINTEQNNTTQNISYNKSYLDDAKTVRKKDLNENNNDIAAHLKSEFIKLNIPENKAKQIEIVELPRYDEDDITATECSCKNNNEDKQRYNKIKHRHHSKESIVVQFMGSEKMSEEDEPMVYESETGNITVRGMLLYTLLFHFLTFTLTNILCFIFSFRTIFIPGITFVLPFILAIGFIIYAACSVRIRHKVFVWLAAVWVIICFSLAMSLYENFFGLATLFRHAYLAITFVDIMCLTFTWSKNYDFSSRGLYGVTITGGLFFLIVGYYIIHTVKDYYDSWKMYVIGFWFTIFKLICFTAQLHFLLDGEWVELSESDYLFGGFLLYVSLFDFPIRLLRKLGALNCCDTGGGGSAEKE